MKRNLILKASGIAFAMALGMVSNPSIAQDYPQTIDNPAPSPEYEPSTPAPRTTDDSYLDQRSGAQGPIRSDESSTMDDSMRYRDSTNYPSTRQQRGASRFPDAARAEMARSSTTPGYLGFLWWRETNSETP